ncbi:SDR family NAD(P)-dependent oxidoreductase [Polynucleobacter sp. MWH-Spelu-300-X4]|uniref:short-chain dehydrogenase/reductase n=1 Tax=Polynucleobacter sp. MWH-Spelu-300-X4 TaxID=2689109 RepID=UPI001BFE1E9D|nr:short-chain dehydrogenase/reductase [Polynucleobacter sp. MWH-Spelu-300-X4]QWD79424.1 SDR family NAD(P)-dependent oxidoreductase [Polynucleobacter sp. MWH-Spelu-300-X4]
MNLNLESKKVLITGGSKGIGYACAELFLAEGAEVAVVSSQSQSIEHALQKLQATYGQKVTGYAVDLSAPDAQTRMAELLADVDILVNNAGAIPGGGLDAIDDERWRKAWDLKVFGYINTIRDVLPKMIQRKSGVIINIIGMAGAAPSYDYVCGSMANASLITFTKAVGGYSSKSGVRVLGVNPGPTETDRLIKLYKERAKYQLGDENRWRELLPGLPFGRPQKPEEIANLVVFLASEKASYLSGLVIDADGGAMYAR